MRRSKRTAVVAVLTAVGVVAIGALATGATPFGGGLGLTNVPTANTRSVGFAPASKLSPELAQIAVAQGSTKVENPTAQVSYYGYDNDVARITTNVLQRFADPAPFVAPAHDAELGRAAKPLGGKPVLESFRVLHRLAIDAHHHVAGF